MADPITLIHTAQAHVARFDALAAKLAPGAVLRHIVRPDLLERARAGGVTDEIRAALVAEFGMGVTLCTCTTLGPAAEAAGAIRIDRPLMEKAARAGGRVLLVVVLHSTLDACRALLADCIAQAGTDTQIETLLIPEVWPLFEAGDMAAFNAAVAGKVNTALNDHSAVVLAQVSMIDAAPLINHPRALTAPELALGTALTTR
ncbi:MAG: hypothetical protein KJP02_03865 [Octadecabacter sp.]|nr:hypothetical protein [Octadecabacter sp.]